jgi:hypothetical protein
MVRCAGILLAKSESHTIIVIFAWVFVGDSTPVPHRHQEKCDHSHQKKQPAKRLGGNFGGSGRLFFGGSGRLFFGQSAIVPRFH